VAVPVTVPRLGWSMDEGTFVEWLKRDGDAVKPGEPLFVLESEKAAENIEAIDAGILRLAPDAPQPGEVVAVGRVLAYVTAAGEGMPETETGRAGEKGTVPRLAATRSLRSGARDDVAVSVSPGLSVSPRARRIARELGVDASALRGTGANGRIRERDVRAAAQVGVVPHTNIRRLIAARMVAGVTQAAPVTLTTKADATALVELRDRLQPTAAPTYTDLIVKLSALALRQQPRLQAQWREDGLFTPNAIHVAVAVETEAGLLAPVVRDADRLRLGEIAARSRELIARARAGRLAAEEMRDGTFTVTNLGMFGIDAFTPILHLPQCAILGMGRVVREPAVVGDTIVPRAMMTLSLTFDHRVVDGAPAARFLDTLRRSIEHPGPLLE
jgi:pyruvate dehydrogenase E2 component (dihydrolipoamide acetyltransferase)